MIYLKQKFNIDPASPRTRDRFVEVAEGDYLATLQRHGGRLVGAWFNHAEWFSQLVHVIEFEGAAEFDAFRRTSNEDEAWLANCRKMRELAPDQSELLLEPVGPVSVSSLQEAIDSSRDEPVGAYTFAILEVAPGKMDRFVEMLDLAKGGFPIIAAWRQVAGNPREIIDLWKGDLGREPYAATNESTDAFFEPLRQIAPRERLVNLYPLPYSPLR